jgi:hypothetical protein
LMPQEESFHQGCHRCRGEIFRFSSVARRIGTAGCGKNGCAWHRRFISRVSTHFFPRIR